MSTSDSYHIFLSHNSKDKEKIEQLAIWLSEKNINVWFDKWQLQPGLPWQDGIEEGIQKSNVIGICIGPSGLGQWEIPEIRAAINQFVVNKKPVIPILLPDSPEDLKLPMLLDGFTWVDFRAGWENEGEQVRLIWAITGVKNSGKRAPIDGNIEPSLDEKSQLIDQYNSKNYRPAFPPPPLWFTDRINELEELKNLIEDHTTLIILGIAGIGKTCLARSFGYNYLPDRLKIWIDCNEDMSVEIFISRIADALKQNDAKRIKDIISIQQVPFRQKAYDIAEILDGYDCILFLDSYENIISKSIHDFVNVLYEVVQKAKIIIMSRQIPPDLVSAVIIGGNKLNGLMEEHSINLLKKLGLNNIEQDLLSEAHKKLKGHPKLLEIFSYKAKYLGTQIALKHLPASFSDIQSYLLTAVLKDLPPSSKELLRIICTFRSPVSEDAICKILKLSDIVESLKLLIDRLLVMIDLNNTYSAHSLVREYCAKELGISPQLHLKVAEYYKALIDDCKVSDKRLNNLIEAYYHFLQAEKTEQAYGIFERLVEELDTIGYYELLTTACKELLDLKDLSQEQYASANTNLGLAYRRIGEFKQSILYHGAALKIYKKIGNSNGEQLNLDYIASVYRQTGEMQKAIKFFRESLAIARKVKDPDKLLYILCNLGTVHRQIGNFGRAVSYHKKGEKLCDSCICSRRIVGRNLQNFSLSYYYLGNISKAKQLILRAIDENKAVGDRRETSDSLQALSLFLWYAGDLDEAERVCMQAIKICQDIGYLRGEANSLGVLGLIYLKYENFNKAKDYIEKALLMRINTKNPHGENRNRSNLAQVFLKLGLEDEALKCLKESIEIACNISDLWGEAFSLWHLGKLQQKQSKYKASLKIFSLYHGLCSILNSPLLPAVDLEINQLSKEFDAGLVDDIQKQTMKIAQNKNIIKHFEYLQNLKCF